MPLSAERWTLTAEYERNLRREHARLHPNGYFKSGRPCLICMLLDKIDSLRSEVQSWESDFEEAVNARS